MRIQAVTPQVLRRLDAELSESGRCNGAGGLAPRSVRLAHTALHLALGRAAMWRLIPYEPGGHETRPAAPGAATADHVVGRRGPRVPRFHQGPPPCGAVGPWLDLLLNRADCELTRMTAS